MLRPTPLSTQTRVLTVRLKAFSDDPQMINYSAAYDNGGRRSTQTRSFTNSLGSEMLRRRSCESLKMSAQLQTGYQHSAITTCHLYIFQPVTPPFLPPNYHYHHPQTTMSWLMISFPLGWQIYSFYFFCHTVDIYQIRQDYLWEGVHRDRIGSDGLGG